MQHALEIISVAQAAATCGVSRNTVGYWIRNKKLPASRVGRHFLISAEDLSVFLKSSGRPVPDALLEKAVSDPHAVSFQKCWQYRRRNTAQTRKCADCIVRKNRLSVCFTARDCGAARYGIECHACDYYLENFKSKIDFIDQIDQPAGVHKDLYIWGANKKFAALCGLRRKDLVGAGIEELLHSDSIETVIHTAKKRALGDSGGSSLTHLYLKNKQRKRGKLKVQVWIGPLTIPHHADFIVGEKVSN